jgi:hypothetical protein
MANYEYRVVGKTLSGLNSNWGMPIAETVSPIFTNYQQVKGYIQKNEGIISDPIIQFRGVDVWQPSFFEVPPDGETGCGDDAFPGFADAAAKEIQAGTITPQTTFSKEAEPKMLTCDFCLQKFKHGYPCKCNKELALRLREVAALENLAYASEQIYRSGMLGGKQ